MLMFQNFVINLPDHLLIVCLSPGTGEGPAGPWHEPAGPPSSGPVFVRPSQVAGSRLSGLRGAVPAALLQPTGGAAAGLHQAAGSAQHTGEIWTQR